LHDAFAPIPLNDRHVIRFPNLHFRQIGLLGWNPMLMSGATPFDHWENVAKRTRKFSTFGPTGLVK